MLLGIQGCGKSLAAKAVAGLFGVPLLRLDFGALYNKYIGETEKNLCQALKTTEVITPCVLWMDEIFFVDLPDAETRKTIFSIHLRRRNLAPSSFDLEQLAESTAKVTPAPASSRSWSPRCTPPASRTQHWTTTICWKNWSVPNRCPSSWPSASNTCATGRASARSQRAEKDVCP